MGLTDVHDVLEGRCVIYPKSKQLCKRCRLDKCYEVGMNPKWVLSHEEKKIRFKHYFKKKEEMAMGLSVTAYPEDQTNSICRLIGLIPEVPPAPRRSKKRLASATSSQESDESTSVR